MLTIRKAKKDDLSELAKIYVKVYDRPKDGEEWSVKDAKKLLDFYFSQKSFLGVTALVEKKIVGAFFTFIKPWYDGKHLGEGELFVDPVFQRQKIGTNLFLEVMKMADKKNCTVHELVAYGEVAKWYKKMGIHETSLKFMSGKIKEILKRIDKSK